MIDEGTGRNMLYEFSRTELLLGKEALDRLKEATVTVLGVGGVGSHCIEALAYWIFRGLKRFSKS